MHDIDHYRQRFVLELALRGLYLEQPQPAHLDYRPHPKSLTAGELFWTIIRGPQIRLDIVRTTKRMVHQSLPIPQAKYVGVLC